MMRVASSYYHVIYNVDDVLFLLCLLLGFLGSSEGSWRVSLILKLKLEHKQLWFYLSEIALSYLEVNI